MIIVETFEPGCQPQSWPVPSSLPTAHDQRAPVTVSFAAPVRRQYLAGNAHALLAATVSAAFDGPKHRSSLGQHPSHAAQGDQKHRRATHSARVLVRKQRAV